MSKFIHLHVHSHYSLLDGLSKVPDLVARAKEMGMGAIALTDHGVMYGAIEFYKECKKQGIKPLVGMEAYVAPRKLTDKKAGVDAKNNHLLLIAKNEVGYKNLIKLTSKAHIEGFYYKPRIDHEYLKEHAEGLIAATACLKGKVPQLLLDNRYDEAKEVALMYQSMFGKDSFYLELEHHPEINKQVEVNQLLIKLGKELNMPFILTKDSHYLQPSDNEAQDALVCIQTGKTIDDKKRLNMTGFDTSLVSEGVMIEYAKELGVPEAIDNTLKIANDCNLELDLLTWHFPKFDVPGDEDSDKYLHKLTYKGLQKREGKITEEDKERLEYELDIIISKNYHDYFLIVADFMNWAHDQKIIATTRGSASGSLVSYALGITSVNPLHFQLPFERFLTKKRPTPPDIDCDIQDSRRDEVIEYVRNKYGKRQVANIGTFGTMKARAAVRDITRVLGLPYALGDKISKMIPQGPQGSYISIDKAKNINPELKEFYDAEAPVKRVMDLAEKIEGCVRHVSVHAAGVVVAPEKLTNFLPLQVEPKGEQIITQYDMHAIDPNVEKETVGLLKADFLGIRNLSILGIAKEIVKHTKNIEVVLDKIPWDDKKTYKLLTSGRTMGVFQLSSSGMTRYLKELEPDNIYDIMAMVALYRPGPMEIIPEYIKRKKNPSSVTYPHPKLKDILERTFGLLIYQDDVMLTAMTLAGYDAEEADKFRHAMGKKIKSLMDSQKIQFIEGCKKNGLEGSKAQQIWGYIEPFAGYGFNKCLVGETQIINSETGEIKTIKRMHEEKKKTNILSLDLDDWKMKTKRVPEIFDNGRKMVWQMTTRTGKKIRATANHPFLKFEGWKNLGDLKVGDKIATARKIDYKTNYKIEGYKLATLGYLLSEGNLCHPHGAYFYSANQDELDDFARSVRQFDNIKLTVNKSKQTISLYTAQIDQKQGNPLMKWLKEMDLWYKKATEKFFPDFVFRLNQAQLSLLMGKMWQGDGCVHAKKYGQIFYSTSSEKIAWGLQHLLLRLEIISTVHTKKFKYRGTIKIGYTINISRFNNVDKFAKTIGKHLIGKKKKDLEKVVGENKILNGQLPPHVARGSKDIIPKEILPIIKQEIYKKYKTLREFGRQSQISERLVSPNQHKTGYLRETVDLIAGELNSKILKQHARSDIYWDEVVNIEKIGIKQTYDLTVPQNHNFVANDIVVHNSHSASYAVVAYQTAYMKANYPSEYMAALMTAESGNTDKVVEAVMECEKMGIEVLPPDIKESLADFTYISDNQIRFGLKAIKNLGSDIIETIIEERKENGTFKSLEDFLKRVHSRNLNKKSLDALVKAGAMDAMGERNQMISNMNRILGFVKMNEKERNTGQYSLFGGKEESGATLTLEPVQEAEEKQRLMWEKEMLGLYVSSHPFKEMAPVFEEATISCKDVSNKQVGVGGQVRIAGIISKIDKVFTRQNELMMFVAVEDVSGMIELVVFPKLLKRSTNIWEEDKFVLLEGKVSDKDDIPKILVDKVVEIDQNNPKEALGQMTGSGYSSDGKDYIKPKNILISVKAKIFNKEMHGSLKNIFEGNHGKNRVYLIIEQNGDTRKIATNFYINLNETITKEIEGLVGEGGVTTEII